MFPGGFGTMDELFEALTLIQTGRNQNFGLVLMGSDYWSGMMDWLRHQMLARNYVAAGDLDLPHLTDEPEEAVNIVLEQMRVIAELTAAQKARENSPS